jgi:hypothetical protein
MMVLVVSNRDRTVRTGTAASVADLYHTINSYIEDGYSLDELVIEGVAEG